MQTQNWGGGQIIYIMGHNLPFPSCPEPLFQSEANSKSLICKPFFFFLSVSMQIKLTFSRKLCTPWPWFEIEGFCHIQLRQSFCPTLFKRDKAFGFHFYLGRIECLMIRRCNMLGGSTFSSVNH